MGSYRSYFVLLTLIFCLATFTVVAQQKLPKIPEMVKINDSTLMCEKEVTIAEWMNFIVNNGYDGSLFPDTACLSRPAKLVFAELRGRKNFKHIKLGRSVSAYERLSGMTFITQAEGAKKFAESDSIYFSLHVPVTGVSFEQVQRHCRWKHDMLANSGYSHFSLKLPSMEVFKKVIPNMDTVSKNCECFMLNCSTAVVFKPSKRKIVDQLQKTQGHGLVPVISYFPTPLGLYNIEGNAAEMTSTDGTAMGGSFRQTARESYNDKFQQYTKPEGWLGFRYIVTIKQ